MAPLQIICSHLSHVCGQCVTARFPSSLFIHCFVYTHFHLDKDIFAIQAKKKRKNDARACFDELCNAGQFCIFLINKVTPKICMFLSGILEVFSINNVLN